MKSLLLLAACAAVVAAAADESGSYAPPSVDGTALFFVDFQDDPVGNGVVVKSSDAKFAGQPVSVRGHDDGGSIQGDTALHLGKAAQHYGLTAPFDEPLDVAEDADFVLQYEVQLTEGLDCGGAYLKVLRDTEDFTPAGLTDSSPYAVMFGPDRCGATNKVHLILQRRNPTTDEWQEKALKDPPAIKSDKLPHLYTLAIHSDNTYAIYIDTDKVKSGSLFEDFDPPVTPPEFVDDPADEKPLDWVDDANIPDPDAVKPDDWDEDAPRTIVDTSVTKPDGWLDDAPLEIPDPEAEIPDDWDEEEDGEFEAPLVPNPACDEAPGCGPWSPPVVPNPEYKGKWQAPLIDNPEYRGVWTPRQIPNPQYYEDDHPHQLPTIAGVAIEIWTMSAGLEFDNLLITTSVNAALDFGEATWRVKHDGMKDHEQRRQRELAREARLQAYEDGTVLDKANFFFLEFADMAAENPVASVVTAVVVVASVVGLCMCTGGGKPVSPIVDSDDDDDDDDVDDANAADDGAAAAGAAEGEAAGGAEGGEEGEEEEGSG